MRDKLALVQSDIWHTIKKEGGGQMAIKKAIASLTGEEEFLQKMQSLIIELVNTQIFSIGYFNQDYYYIKIVCFRVTLQMVLG